MDQWLQQLYVAYFNRPADPAGLAYWNKILQQGQPLSVVSAEFAKSPEYKALFAGKSWDAAVDAIYVNLFGRHAEPAGLRFYADLLAAQKASVDTVVADIAAGALGSDAAAFAAKVNAASAMTAALAANAPALAAYAANDARVVSAARAFLAEVKDAASLADALAGADTAVARLLLSNAAAPQLSDGRNGQVLTEFSRDGYSHYVEGMAVQADGKFVVAGGYHVGRYNADGTLDTSFGKGGWLEYRPGGFTDVQVLANGKILLSGNGERVPQLTRLNADGSLDTSFGGGTGKVVMDFGPGVTEYVGKIQVAADGGIVATGYYYAENGSAAATAVARFHADGSPDTAFNGSGLTTPAPNAIEQNFFLQADGKVLQPHWYGAVQSVLRYGADGQLDASFGDHGKVLLKFPSWVTSMNLTASLSTALTQADGKILVAGQAPLPAKDGIHQFGFALARLNADGSLDKTFSGDGMVALAIHDAFQPSQWQGGLPQWTWIDSTIYKLAVRPDGKIVAAGSTHLSASANPDTGFEAVHESRIALMRFNADGSVDTTFGNGGQVLVDAQGRDSLVLRDMEMLADGDILIAGDSTGGGNVEMLFARFNEDGTPDAGFNDRSALPWAGVEGYPATLVSAAVRDADLAALDGGAGNYHGASITLERKGGANADDLYFATGDLEFKDGRALLDGVDVGAVSNTSGSLRIDFNWSASQARVNEVLHSVAWRQENGAAGTVQLEWSFSDGQKSSTLAANVEVAALEVPYWIDALLPNKTSSAQQLRDTYLGYLGEARTFDVAFPVPGGTENILTPAGKQPNYQQFTAAEQAAAWRALDYVGSVLNLKFVAGSATSTNSMSFINHGLGFQGWATYPNGASIGSNIAVDFKEGQPGAGGGLETRVLLHEIGHALGIKHPFDEQVEGRVLPSAESDFDWTLMAYTGAQSSEQALSMAFSPLDIAVLQYLYGPSATARAGNDTYVLSETGPNFIWDGAGIDTISAAASSKDLVLHLDPGHWDHLGAAGAYITSAGQVTVNFGSVIENAVGGKGNDRIVGNAGDNRIDGGAGADTLTGGAGADQFVLGDRASRDTITDFTSGSDKLVVSGLKVGVTIVAAQAAGLDLASAAAAIGSAATQYAVGAQQLFAVHGASDSALYLFTSSGADAQVSTAELTELVRLVGTTSLAAGDIVAS